MKSTTRDMNWSNGEMERWDTGSLLHYSITP
jgi:hypothetical protein